MVTTVSIGRRHRSSSFCGLCPWLHSSRDWASTVMQMQVAIIVGLGMTLYAAVYVLFPLLTNGVKLYSQWMANIHFWGTLVGGIGMGAFMGMAGLQGMLRRTIYMEGEFTPYMWLACISGALILIGFIFFMINIIMSVGLKGLLGIFTKSKLDTKDLVPAA